MENNLILMTINRRIVCLKTIAFDEFASYGELGVRRSAVVFTTWRNLGKLPIPLLKSRKTCMNKLKAVINKTKYCGGRNWIRFDVVMKPTSALQQLFFNNFLNQFTYTRIR